MKIVIASKGRTHLLDCARELQKFGHQVTFYTCTPSKNFRRYGLEKGGISLLPVLAPFVALSLLIPCNFTRALYARLIDRLVAILMPKCDLFIGASPNFTYAMKKARARFGAVIILERGASHVRLYNKMSMLSGQPSMTEWYMKNDESQYTLADYIALGSDYMAEGFISEGIENAKLFSNPYGVSLTEFPPTAYTGEYDCIYVGRWSKRKGCELIIEAFKDTNIKVLHVGMLDDIPFPELPNFTHVDPVPQNELYKYYAKAKVFIFPSFDDGFGMVLCQAYACGLPIVASKKCGSTTMVRLLDTPNDIRTMKELSAEHLLNTTKMLLAQIDDTNGVRDNHRQAINSFSWEAYGLRYNEFLTTITKHEK